MKKLMILSSILFSVNSLMAVNDYSSKSKRWDLDKTHCSETDSKFSCVDDLKADNSYYFFSDKPVQLEYFNASFLNEGIVIKWQILTDNKDLKFELEKSYDGVYFERLSIIDGDCMAENNFYTFLDTELKLNSEIVYYRIKQIDKNERFNYSDIIYLDSTSELGFNF